MNNGKITGKAWTAFGAAAALLILGAAAFLILFLKSYPTRTYSDLEQFTAHELTVAEGNTVLTTGSDAGLTYENTDGGLLCLEIDLGRISVPDPDVQEVMIQLYYDEGRGMSELRSQKILAQEGRNYIATEHGRTIRMIRIDIGREPGAEVVIRRITMNPRHIGSWVLVFVTAVFFLFLSFAVGTKMPLSVQTVGYLYTILYAVAGLFVAQKYPTADTLILMTGIALYGLLLIFSAAAAYLTDSGSAGKNERIFLILLLAGVFFLYFFTAHLMPFADGPDEVMRFRVVDYIRVHGVLPRGDDPEIRDPLWGFSYAFYPMLPYIIAGYLTRLVSLFTQDFRTILMTARLVSILSGVGLTFYMWRIGRRLFDSMLRYALPVFAGFFPLVIYTSSYVSTEMFSVMATAMAVYYMIAGIQENWRFRDLIGLSVSLSFVLLSYYNAYGIVLVSVPFFFLTASYGKGEGQHGIAKGVFTAVLTVVLAGWWFVRNAVLYNGDLFGRASLNAEQQQYISEEVREVLNGTPKNLGISLREMLIEMEYLKKTYFSFASGFSKSELMGRPIVYYAFLFLFGIGLLGLLISLVRWIGSRKKRGRSIDKKYGYLYAALLLSMLFPAVIAVYYSYASDFQPQGRYYLPGFTALAIFLCYGLQSYGGTGRRASKESSPGRILPGSLLMAASLLIIAAFMSESVLQYYL